MAWGLEMSISLVRVDWSDRPPFHFQIPGAWGETVLGGWRELQLTAEPQSWGTWKIWVYRELPSCPPACNEVVAARQQERRLLPAP